MTVAVMTVMTVTVVWMLLSPPRPPPLLPLRGPTRRQAACDRRGHGQTATPGASTIQGWSLKAQAGVVQTKSAAAAWGGRGQQPSQHKRRHPRAPRPQRGCSGAAVTARVENTVKAATPDRFLSCTSAHVCARPLG